ncbi:MAG: terminase, partial [Proteobacteria bacterium]|nr:terminase [Pseudomonadota bacterium]
YITDMRRGQWSPDERDAIIKQTAQLDGAKVKIRLAQDPGQAGVDQAQRLTRMLAGYPVRSERVSGAKDIRASGFGAQVNAGNVRMVRAGWNGNLIEELRQFPQGRNDDIVDALSDAFNELTLAGQSSQGKLLR